MATNQLRIDILDEMWQVKSPCTHCNLTRRNDEAELYCVWLRADQLQRVWDTVPDDITDFRGDHQFTFHFDRTTPCPKHTHDVPSRPARTLPAADRLTPPFGDWRSTLRPPA
jgi:hypothetical protein